MLAYLEMMRPGNCAMSIIAVAIGALLASGGSLAIFLNPLVYIAMLVVFVITGAGNVINDYVDLEADKINRPNRPIPSGRVSERAGRNFSILLFLVGIFFSVFLTFFALVLAVFNTIVLIVYSYKLQNKIFLGNLAVGYLVGSTFLFGGAVLGNMFLPFLLMLLAMFSSISREIVKDLEDLEGDRKSFMKKLAKDAKKIVGERFGIKGKQAEMKLTKKRAKTIAIFSMIIAILASPLPFIFGIFGIGYLVILIPTDLMFIYSIYLIYKANVKKEYHKASKIIKIGMNLGLLAFVVGALLI